MRNGRTSERSICSLIDDSHGGPIILGRLWRNKALITEPAKLATSSGSDLVGILSGEMQSKAKDLIKQQQDLIKHDQSGYRSKTIEACTSASAILSKTTAEEAIAYKSGYWP